MQREIDLNAVGGIYLTLGDTGIRTLVDRFYDIMDSNPDAGVIRRLHPTDLNPSREKLYSFLVGRFGGPPLYVEKYGQPMLRAKHAPFSIGDTERDQWLNCMNQAISECIADKITAETLRQFLAMVADSMRNRTE